MAQTQIPVGHPMARKLYSVALFAATQRRPSLMKILTGPAPKQADAERKLKGQTSPDMPFVRVTDLSKTAGDTISVDLFNIIGGKPIMGDRNSEGKGEGLTSSSMDISINLATKGVDVGGKMAQQRTLHSLRGIGMANLAGWWKRFSEQKCLVHAAGARGSQAGLDWVVPLDTDSDFSEIMVNSIKAPTYNRHYVADGTTIVQGGLQLQSIDSTDTLKLEHLDALATLIDDMEFKLQPVKIEGDPAADDEPMYVMYVTNRQWNSILTNTSNLVWRTFLQNAWNRASAFTGGKKHPLFTGEPGMWRNILIRKMDRAIRFLPSDSFKYVAVANKLTATESTGTVNGSLGAGKAVDRALLFGAQALAYVYGRNQNSDYYMTWHERRYNLERNLEIHADSMGGEAKVRFPLPNSDGDNEPTDHGVIAFDTAVSLT